MWFRCLRCVIQRTDNRTHTVLHVESFIKRCLKKDAPSANEALGLVAKFSAECWLAFQMLQLSAQIRTLTTSFSTHTRPVSRRCSSKGALIGRIPGNRVLRHNRSNYGYWMTQRLHNNDSTKSSNGFVMMTIPSTSSVGFHCGVIMLDQGTAFGTKRIKWID
jgi:hypothetical protein